MTRERWEQILFAHVGDEVVQDMLNQYVLELESSNAKLRELCRDLKFCMGNDCLRCSHGRFCDLRINERCDELGVTK